MDGTRKASAPNRRQVVLVLQGGGALGAYQAGVFEALDEAGVEPDWVIGTSIGAINAALIAGNAPADRLPRLRAFWDRVSHDPALENWASLTGLSAVLPRWATLAGGVAGFFRPNPLAFLGWQVPLTPEHAGYYSTALLTDTLAGLIDAADGRCRECPHRGDALFRQPRDAARPAACHGLRRAAAGLPGGAHRGRAVVGWRHPVERAGRMRLRRQPTARLPGLRRAYLEPGGAGARDHRAGAASAEGPAIRQPRGQPHQAPAADAPAAARDQRAGGAAAGRGGGASRNAGTGHLWLSHGDACGAAAGTRPRPRRPCQGHRLQPRRHPRALGGGPRRQAARPWEEPSDPLEGFVLHELRREVMPVAG